jgi:hypothetical protein
MEILTYIARGMVRLVFISLTSSIREPVRRRFLAVKITGAGVFGFFK